jgi:NAD dependent epimerase/dehydratase
MNWKGKRVLVTGAGGFIGSHLTERLVELGAEVRAFVHYNGAGRLGWLDDSAVKDHLEIAAGDVRDEGMVRKAVQGREAVFHLAALIGIPYSYNAPVSYVQVNVQGTLNVLMAVRESGVERFVHTSTSETYGTAQYVPIDEKHPLQGQSPYSASKIGADKMVESFYLSFGVPAVTVRPFNTYGPRQSARAVIPAIIAQCMAGSKVRLGHTTPTRDLNYVTDTVEGFVLAAASQEAIGQVINIGSGVEISIGDLAKKIAGKMGRTVEIETDPARERPRQSEVERLLGDNSKAARLLGWKPQIGLDDGLSRTIEWFERKQPAGYGGKYAV